MASRRFRLSLTVAFAGAVLVAMSGLAYAGALPTPAQSVASGVLDKVGVSLPASHNESADDAGAAAPTADHPSGTSEDRGATEGTGGATGDDTGSTGGSGGQGSNSLDHGKGKEISQLAHDTPAPGKGKVISVVASGGKSHAGNPPGQAKKGDNGEHGSSHAPDHPDHPSQGGGNGHEHGGSGGHGNGS